MAQPESRSKIHWNIFEEGYAQEVPANFAQLGAEKKHLCNRNYPFPVSIVRAANVKLNALSW